MARLKLPLAKMVRAKWKSGANAREIQRRVYKSRKPKLGVSTVRCLRREGLDRLRLPDSWGSAAQAFTASLKRIKLQVLLVDGIALKPSGSDRKSMSERRNSVRTRALKGARIVYGNGSLTRDCAVRNLSATGAKLVMQSTAGIPDRFELFFEDGARKNCIVRWRKIADIGVEFADEA